MKTRKVALLLVIALVVALGVAAAPAAAYACGCWGGPTPTPSPTAPTSSWGSWCGGGYWNGSGTTWGGTGTWGIGFGGKWLLNHPDAFNAWLDLRTSQLDAIKAWYGQYSSAPFSAAAQTSLRTLWQQNWTDVKAWYQQYASGAAWVCPTAGCWGRAMWGTGFGGGWLLRHPGAFADWIDLRLSTVNDVKAWFAQYSADPFSTTAQMALQTLRTEQRAEVVKFFSDHGITLRAKWGCGGWMGLGGMWGGFGW